MPKKSSAEMAVAKMIANPFYAINIDPELCLPHQTLISKGDWIKANENLVKELGVKKWLETLLSNLEAVDKYDTIVERVDNPGIAVDNLEEGDIQF